MSNDKLSSLFDALKSEIKTIPGIDEATHGLLEELEQNLQDLKTSLETDSQPEDSPLDTAIALEAHFASQHPTAERVIRELIDTLNKIGI